MTSSTSDNQPGRKAGCRVCGQDLDPVLTKQGQYTHPTCDPQLDPVNEGRAMPTARRQADALLDLYGRTE